jgi:predicted nucleic acid-binding protein
MIVVSNSTPLIDFGKVSQLLFLKDLYQQIYIPEEVWKDLIRPEPVDDLSSYFSSYNIFYEAREAQRRRR